MFWRSHFCVSESDEELIARRRASRLAAGQVAEAPDELRLKIGEAAAGGGIFSDCATARSGGEICRNILFYMSPSGDVLQRAMLSADDPEMRCWAERAEAVYSRRRRGRRRGRVR